MFVVLLFSTYIVFGEMISSFILSYGVALGDDKAYSVQETSDGGFVVAGYSMGVGGQYDVLLSKFDSVGIHTWSTTMGGSGGSDFEEGRSVQETSDGGFVVAGRCSSFGADYYDVLLTKFNISGGHVWTVLLGLDGSNFVFGESAQEISDGGFIVTGYSDVSDEDVFLTKFNSSGGHVWTTTMGGSNDERGNSIHETSDGGMIVAGSTRNFGPFSVLLSKFNRSGGHVWTTVMSGGGSYEIAESVQETSDGGIIITGGTDSFGFGFSDLLLSKFTSNGIHIWTTVLGGLDYEIGYSVQEMVSSEEGGGFIVTGVTNSFNAFTDDQVLISHFNSSGGHIRTITVGEGTDVGTSIQGTSDGGFIITGFSRGFGGEGDWDVLVSKFGSVEDFQFCEVCEEVFPEVDYITSEELSFLYDPVSLEVEDKTSSFVWRYIDPSIITIQTSSDPRRIYYEMFLCFGVNSVLENETCSNHGECTFIDTCLCDQNYWGSDCQINMCDGILTNSTTEIICFGHGNCTNYDQCSCEDNYFGKFCDIIKCDGVFSNESDTIICSGHGNCTSFDVCECEIGFYDPYESFCGDWDCFNTHHSNDSLIVCSGHGECIAPDVCECEQTGYYNNYTGAQCQIWRCGIETWTSGYVCSTHGDCVNTNNCSCWDTQYYDGDFCEKWKCFGVKNIEVDEVCGGHGYCVDVDECSCLSGYSSLTYLGECTEWNCGVHHKDSEEVCSSLGTCTSLDICECRNDYHGDECELWSCGGIIYFSASTCSGRGVCEEPNLCDCDVGYSGSLCQTNILAIAISVPLAVLSVVFLFFCVVCCLLCIGGLLCTLLSCACLVCTLLMVIFGISSSQQSFKIKKFTRLKNFNILLKEQELEEDESIAHIRIDRSLFEIPMEEIKLEKILGEGGSSSVVYLANWKGKKVAFKCFKTRVVCSSQDSFDEFEREIAVLGSIFHPNIISCFGCSLKPPRVGIMMEYCSNGDLSAFLQRFNIENQTSYPMKEKIRCLLEISNSMEFVHSRNIIHRDLKLENVLLDGKENCKLMDFGLSRIVDRMSQKKTRRIGTSFYMAPEITIGLGTYDQKVDVFSFGMVMWIVATEMYFSPFGEEEDVSGIEMKMANNPNFRPDCSSRTIYEAAKGIEDDKFSRASLKWYEKLMRNCWDHNPVKRPDFKVISRVIQEKYDKYSSSLVSSSAQEQDRECSDDMDETEVYVETESFENMNFEQLKVKFYELKSKLKEKEVIEKELLKWKNMYLSVMQEKKND